MLRFFFILIIIYFTNTNIKAQCFATSGNPIGGTENIGIMRKNALRISAFYRHLYSGKYFKENKLYTGDNRTLKYAYYNYMNLFFGYGLLKKLSIESECGYFINKTQVYRVIDNELTGKGPSNFVFLLKPNLYYNADKRFQVSFSLGVNIPFSREFQRVNGTMLPIDLQPSTGSYGTVFNAFVVKENSFRGIRFFFVSRIEKYFENKYNYLFGTIYYNSLFFSKHFVFEERKLKDWTVIMQLRTQYKEPNYREGNKVAASGSFNGYFVPQINLSLKEKINIFLLTELPAFQYYNNIQLGTSFALSMGLTYDINFKK